MENFFNPKSVAVIGATADKNKVGFSLVSNLVSGKDPTSLKLRRARKIFPVTLNEKEILGIKTFVSILDIPDDIDLAIIAVRADIVPKILEDCGKKKIPNAIIISSGFKEIGEVGKKLEDSVAQIAKENNIMLLGPNCLGVIDTQSDLNASFSGQKPLKGRIAFLSQSGALGTAMIDWTRGEGIGFSKFVSLGNESVLTEVDFLKYLENDSETDAILMYLENINDGAEFMKVVSRITPKKPVVIIKAGMGGHGNLAVMSHTGALAPQSTVFISACKQAGAVTVSSLRGIFNITKLLSQGVKIEKEVQKLIILTNGGGPSVIAADLIDHSKSLSLVEFSDEVKEKLRKVLPPMAAVGNPVDIIGDSLAERYDKALEILSEIKEADGIIVILTPQMMTEVEETAKVLAKYKDVVKIFPVFIGGPSIEDGKKSLIKNGMVHFTFSKDVIEGLDSLAGGMSKVSSSHLQTKVLEDGNLKMMKFEKMENLFDEYGIEISGIFVKEKFDIAPLLKKMKLDPPSPEATDGRGSFAMKVISGDIVHKTEIGAVVLNLKSAEEAEKFWDEWKTRPKATIDGMVIQPMAVGREVIIGMKRDPTFGGTVLFGLGGILAESLKDTSIRIAPIEKEEALKMMKEIKGIKILEGLRGEKPVDFDSIADIIVNLSHLAVDHSEIKEIDLNPVMATPDGSTIVDARIML